MNAITKTRSTGRTLSFRNYAFEFPATTVRFYGSLRVLLNHMSRVGLSSYSDPSIFHNYSKQGVAGFAPVHLKDREVWVWAHPSMVRTNPDLVIYAVAHELGHRADRENWGMTRQSRLAGRLSKAEQSAERYAMVAALAHWHVKAYRNKLAVAS